LINSTKIAIFRDQTTNGPCNIDPDTLTYDENCIFILDPDYLPSSSLMSLVNKDSVVEFCNDYTHIQWAPNKHNDMCNVDSVWSVISRHPDFANNKLTNMITSFQSI